MQNVQFIRFLEIPNIFRDNPRLIKCIKADRGLKMQCMRFVDAESSKYVRDIRHIYGYKIDRQYDSSWLISIYRMYTRVRGTT